MSASRTPCLRRTKGVESPGWGQARSGELVRRLCIRGPSAILALCIERSEVGDAAPGSRLRGRFLRLVRRQGTMRLAANRGREPGTLTPVCVLSKPALGVWITAVEGANSRGGETVGGNRRVAGAAGRTHRLLGAYHDVCATTHVTPSAVVASRTACRPCLNPPTHSNGLIEGFSAA